MLNALGMAEHEKEIDGGIVTQKEISLSPPSVRKSHQIKGTTTL